jgi:hypothetical protein
MTTKRIKIILISALLVVIVWSVSTFKTQREIPEYSQEEMKEAIIYFNKFEEFDKALLLAKEYVSLYPDDTDGWNHRGYAYYGLGNCPEAFSDFYHASVNGNETADSLIASVANSETCKNP